jgi:NitT/TauT family transport system permease protein
MERYGYLIMIISLPIVWQVLVWTSGFEPFILPGPMLVVNHLIDDWSNFLYHTGITMLGALLGYTFANIFAVAIAILFVYVPSVQSILMPWFIVIKNIPYVVIAPILILTLGATALPKIIVVFLVTFFPLVANISAGLRAADDVLLDRMRVLNASRWQIFWKVRWPAAVPYYMAAHEIAFTGAIIAAIVAEFFFSREGLGYLIVTAMETYRADTLYGVTLVAGVLGVGNYLLVVRLRKWVMRWQDA